MLQSEQVREADLHKVLKQRLADISETDAQDWFLVSRARYGMELVFQTLADTYGTGEVITQPLTCVTAVNPILYAGHKPVYCDITLDNLSIDASLLQKLINKNTRAIVVQHSFGMPADVEHVPKDADGPIIIEDFAHRLGFIARVNKKPVADISIHSFGAEKLLNTRFGGAVWVNPEMRNKALHGHFVTLLQKLLPMSLVAALKVQAYPPLNGILNRLPTTLSTFTRKILTSTKLLYSPIVPAELMAQKPEPARLPSKATVQAVLSELTDFDTNLQLRKTATAAYLEAIDSGKFIHTVPRALIGASLPCVRFPILLDPAVDAEQTFLKLRAMGYAAGKWYRPLLFPGPKSYDTYGYQAGSCPVAEDAAARIINLPTSPNISPAKAKEIIDAIDR